MYIIKRGLNILSWDAVFLFQVRFQAMDIFKLFFSPNNKVKAQWSCVFCLEMMFDIFCCAESLVTIRTLVQIYSLMSLHVNGVTPFRCKISFTARMSASEPPMNGHLLLSSGVWRIRLLYIFERLWSGVWRIRLLTIVRRLWSEVCCLW